MRRLALGAAIVLAGCRLELTDPIDPSKPAVSLLVRLQDTVVSMVRISGVLRPGTGTDGLVRPVIDPALRVGGWTIPPKGVDARGGLQYDTAWSFDGDTFGGAVLDFQAPELPGVPPPMPLRVLVPWRAGPKDITHQRGDNLVLPLATPGDSGIGPGSWSLVLRNDRYVLLAIYGLGSLRPPVEVPGRWLADAPADVIRVELTGQQSASADNGYLVQLQTVVRIEWRVVLVEP